MSAFGEYLPSSCLPQPADERVQRAYAHWASLHPGVAFAPATGRHRGLQRPSPLPFLVIALIAIISGPLRAQHDSISFNGQLAGRLGAGYSPASAVQAGLRFLPELYYLHPCKKAINFDVDLSANLYSSAYMERLRITNGELGVKPYRATLRLSSKQWEVRGGLQKISFGSATLLRPLMWFDGTDPRDPLHLTEGVYGLLGRYYFLDNTNIWLWGLYGNENLRGWDAFPAYDRQPEFGGRVQFPFLKGDLGFSYHHRHPGMADMERYGFPGLEFQYYEDRAGIDGKWDIGPGIWFEYVLKHNSRTYPRIADYESYLDLGADYTFKWGNGLNLILEHFIYKSYQPALLPVSNANITAAALAYPLGFGERVSLMVYRAWEDQSWYRFITISKEYENLSLYVLLYWNPEYIRLYNSMNGANGFAGKGFEVLASYNF